MREPSTTNQAALEHLFKFGQSQVDRLLALRDGMDPRQRLHLMGVLTSLGDQGRTVLFSSHILDEVEQIASSIQVMVAGRHAASGDFRQIRRLMTQRPHRYVLRSSDDRALDGSIAYVLAKPIRRSVIVVTKLAVALLTVLAFGALPVLLGGLVLTGEIGALALAYCAGAVAASVAYAALFLMLAVLTRSAVVVGLLYALVWESLVGQFVPGAKALSVQQAGLSIAERVLGDDARELGIGAAVELHTGLAILVVTTVGAVLWATYRLARLHLSEQE